MIKTTVISQINKSCIVLKHLSYTWALRGGSNLFSPSCPLEGGIEYERKLKRVNCIAHETAIFGNPPICSFTGDKKKLKDPQ